MKGLLGAIHNLSEPHTSFETVSVGFHEDRTNLLDALNLFCVNVQHSYTIINATLFSMLAFSYLHIPPYSLTRFCSFDKDSQGGNLSYARVQLNTIK